jgi:hypothetical protein
VLEGYSSMVLINLVVPPSTENTSKTKVLFLSGNVVLIVDESKFDSLKLATVGKLTPVRVTVCVEVPLVRNTLIDAWVFVEASSSCGKFVNVKVTLFDVVSVVTLPSSKSNDTDPLTDPFATTFCPQSLRTSFDWS